MQLDQVLLVHLGLGSVCGMGWIHCWLFRWQKRPFFAGGGSQSV